MKYIVSFLALLTLVSCSSSKEPESLLLPHAPKKIYTNVYDKALGTISRKVRSNQEFVRCMDQSVNSCISSSVMLMARGSKDVRMCNELTDIDVRNACRQSITILNAREEKNIKLCDTLETGKTACRGEILTLLASEKKDIKLCEEITGSGSVENTEGQAFTAESDCKMQVLSLMASVNVKDCDSIK